MNTINIDTNSNELLNFINSECYNKRINYKTIFRYFNKCAIKSINEMDEKFSNIENKEKSVIAGVNMLFHIYFILIYYTNNTKLTIFLLERSILLYTEFIVMSNDKKMIEDIIFAPNINDAICFSIKKTIGNLKLNTITKFIKNYEIKKISLLLKDIYIVLYKKIYNETSDNKGSNNKTFDNKDYLNVYNIISEYILKLYNTTNNNKHIMNDYYEQIIFLLNETVSVEQIIIKILLLCNHYEILKNKNYLTYKNKNKKIRINLFFDKLIDHHFKILDMNNINLNVIEKEYNIFSNTITIY